MMMIKILMSTRPTSNDSKSNNNNNCGDNNKNNNKIIYFIQLSHSYNVISLVNNLPLLDY